MSENSKDNSASKQAKTMNALEEDDWDPDELDEVEDQDDDEETEEDAETEKAAEPTTSSEMSEDARKHLLFRHLAQLCKLDKNLMTKVMKLCAQLSLPNENEGEDQGRSEEEEEQELGFDVSLNWLDSEEVITVAEAQHSERFPCSKLVIKVVKAEFPAGVFQIDVPNTMCKLVFDNLFYETLVIEDSNTPEWNDVFMWKNSSGFKEDSEIRCAVLKQRDTDSFEVMGTCDIPLSLPLSDIDSWLEEKFDLVDPRGNAVGCLYLNLKYSPVRVRTMEQENVLDELGSNDDSQKKLIKVLLEVAEGLHAVEAIAKNSQEHMISEIKETCRAVLMARKSVDRPCVTLAKKILRENLGLEKANAFIANSFGSEIDSEDSDLGQRCSAICM